MEVSSTFVVPTGSSSQDIPNVVTNLNVAHDTIAVANSHGDIYILNSQCEHRTSLRAHDTPIWSLASSPDGRILASGGRDGVVKIWDTENSTCLHTLSAHTETVRNLVVKNSDTVISSGNSTDPDFPIKVWDVSSGTCIHTLIGHGETVLCMVLDGNRLVTGSKDGTIKIWDLSTGQCQHTLEGHSHEVWKVALCEDGRIVSGDVQGEVKVWDHQNGSNLATLEGHNDIVTHLAIHGSSLVSSDAQGTLRLWNLDTYTQTRTVHAHPDSSVVGLAILEDGSIMTAGSDGRMLLWDPELKTTATVLKEGLRHIWKVVLTETGFATLSQQEDQTMVELWTSD